MADVNNIKEIEELFEFQDFNKKMKLNANTEEQVKRVEKIGKRIERKMKELYVPCK